MLKFRKKPVVIEAVQFNPDHQMLLDQPGKCMFLQWPIFQEPGEGKTPYLNIETLEGTMRANSGDWIIKGVNGEHYPCKSDIFERTYEASTPDSLTFGRAIEILKASPMQAKVAREGWNGKGMWIALMSGLQLPPFNTQGTEKKVNDRTAALIGRDAPLDAQPYIALWTAQGKWQPGWIPSQADLLAEDWYVVAE